MHRATCILLGLWLGAGAGPAAGQIKVLFDASHGQNAGNADWVLDADVFDLNQPHFPCGASNFANESRAQRFPSPDSSLITPTTPETFWTGGISAFGVDLVKLGYQVESLPPGAAITWADMANPQDLSLVDVFVLVEPNRPFDTGETLAIRDFVAAGGGLLLITDHQTSDRDCDGQDSPHIGNDLMGVVISGGAIADYGLFGIAFNVEQIAGQTGSDFWFTDAIDDNVTVDPADPIIRGPHGDGSGGLGLFGATSMTIDPATNASVRGHVWKTDAVGQGLTRVTFASATFLGGRIACVGDSSPADDGTGDPGDNLYPGWDQAAGGVNNREIHLNAIAWLAGDDTSPPTITAGPQIQAFDCTAETEWTTDEPADSRVDYGQTTAYGFSEFVQALTVEHRVQLSGLSPGTSYHFRAVSSDAAGNGPTSSADGLFTTTAAMSPALDAGPTVSDIGGFTARINWSTDEPADSIVRYGSTPGYGSIESDPALTTLHEVSLSGLSPSTTYHFSVESSDGCGNGPATSADDTFTTTPAQVDISGWSLLQFNSSQSFVFPQGTLIPGSGYLVLARDASQAAFESEWGPLPAGTVFVDSAGTFPFINGGESFELRDSAFALVDGPTIVMAAGTTIQRDNPADPPGAPGSWTVAGSAAGSPGSGAGTPSAAGVVIQEASDAASFDNEFVELYFDAAPAGPDTVPPAAIDDLSAEPRSDHEVRLRWSAPGDDADMGTATAYAFRRAARPILTLQDFVAATSLGGAPAPAAAGTLQQWNLNGLDPSTPYYFAVRSADEAANLSALSSTAGATTGPPGSGAGEPPAQHLVISELQTRGPADADDEFIEIYNPTPDPLDLSGHSLQYKSAAGTSFLRVDLPAVVVTPGGYFLAARPAGQYSGSVPADLSYSAFLMSATGGHLFLVDSTATLSSCTDGSIVDKLGYGTANCPEAVPASAHAAGQSLERLPGASDPACGNGTDRDDNAADFALRAMPDPRNTATVEPACRDLGPVGPSLFLGGSGRDELQWGAALGGVDYKVRRSTAPDFMLTHPIPDETHLLQRTSSTRTTDSSVPAPSQVYFYFVSATDGGTGESAE